MQLLERGFGVHEQDAKGAALRCTVKKRVPLPTELKHLLPGQTCVCMCPSGKKYTLIVVTGGLLLGLILHPTLIAVDNYLPILLQTSGVENEVLDNFRW